MNESPLLKCRVYTLNNIAMIHIAEFASITHRSVQSTRALIEKGNVVRKLKFYRDRSRLMIPVIELYGYPLIKAGHSEGVRQVFHYDDVQKEDGTVVIEKVLCTACTYGMGCARRQAADALVVPEGDK